MKFEDFCEDLTQKIQNAYTEGVTLQQAEQLAGEFLYGQLKVSAELKNADLDMRMRKAELKSLTAKAYINAATGGDKKPTEAAIKALIDSDPFVAIQQKEFDAAEVNKEDLERYYQIFREAHIHFRGVSKGRFD